MEGLATKNWILGSTIAAVVVIVGFGIQIINMLSRILIQLLATIGD